MNCWVPSSLLMQSNHPESRFYRNLSITFVHRLEISQPFYQAVCSDVCIATMWGTLNGPNAACCSLSLGLLCEQQAAIIKYLPLWAQRYNHPEPLVFSMVRLMSFLASLALVMVDVDRWILACARQISLQTPNVVRDALGYGNGKPVGAQSWIDWISVVMEPHTTCRYSR